MEELNQDKVCEILNQIMEYELAGVVRYTHSSLMVSGPNRIPIVQFLQSQATESLDHAQQAGEFYLYLLLIHQLDIPYPKDQKNIFQDQLDAETSLKECSHLLVHP